MDKRQPKRGALKYIVLSQEMFENKKRNLETQDLLIFSWEKQLLFEKSLLPKDIIL